MTVRSLSILGSFGEAGKDVTQPDIAWRALQFPRDLAMVHGTAGTLVMYKPSSAPGLE